MNKRHSGRLKSVLAKNKCKVVGCENEASGSLGFCHTHYIYSRRGIIDVQTGTRLREPQRVASYGGQARCIVPGCLNRPKGRGLCAGHYQQWSNGNLEAEVVVPDRSIKKDVYRIPDAAICLLPECDRRPVSRGMCSRHSQQREAGIIDAQGQQLRPLLPMGCKRNRESWVGSRRDGYVLRVAPIGHPHARADGTILEHRLVMEQALGRYLEEWEDVHHKSGVRSDNSPENLELLDGRANSGTEGHPPGHEFDQATAIQVLLQREDISEELRLSLLEQLEKLRKK